MVEANETQHPITAFSMGAAVSIEGRQGLLERKVWNHRRNTFYGTVLFEDRSRDTFAGTLPGARLGLEEQQQLLKKLAPDFRFHTTSRVARHVFYMGCDPEVFVLGESGQVLPAFHFLKSREEAGKTIAFDASETPQLAPFYDGFQAEFCTPAASCLEVLATRIRNGLALVRGKARKVDPKIRLTAKSFLEIAPETFYGASEEHRALGCMPSFSTYGLQGQLEDAENLPFRTAGGHIHFGTQCAYRSGGFDNEAAVRLLDKIVGVIGVSVADGLDSSERRKFYGVAGEYRTPKHGFEYRVLSNFWLAAPALFHLMFELARFTVYASAKGWADIVWNATEEETIEIIQQHDVERARYVIARNEDRLRRMFRVIFAKHGSPLQKTPALALMLCKLGHTALLKDSDNIERYWGIQPSVDKSSTPLGFSLASAAERYKGEPI